MKLVNPTNTFQQVTTQIPLLRRGAWLHGGDYSWQMSSVIGPLEAEERDGRQYFHVMTTSKQKLVVSRAIGNRGMRELLLESVLEVEPVPLFAALLSA